MFLIQNMRIANAYELAAGNDPSNVSFGQGKMRKHLVKCLEKARFEPFLRHSNTARFRIIIVFETPLNLFIL